MAATFPLMLAMAGCAAPLAPQGSRNEPLRVMNGDLRFAHFEGAAARKRADALCGPRGVRTSIYDRFEGGAWVFPEGCA
jgi:hypothetical protein